MFFTSQGFTPGVATRQLKRGPPYIAHAHRARIHNVIRIHLFLKRKGSNQKQLGLHCPKDSHTQVVTAQSLSTLQQDERAYTMDG